MCLILHRPADKTFDKGLFVHAMQNNPHGFGMMSPDAKNPGKVKVVKGMFNLQQIYRIWDAFGENREVAAHFRFTTLGAKTEENCHPFQVLSLEENGRDLYMMHNGTLGSVPRPNENMSDTWHFVTNYLKSVLVQKPDLIDNKEFQKFLGELIGGSKLLFMDGNGLVCIINDRQGAEHEGCWISNTYSIKGSGISRGHDGKTKREATTTDSNIVTTDYQNWDDEMMNEADRLNEIEKRNRRHIRKNRARAMLEDEARAERERELNEVFLQMNSEDEDTNRGFHSMTDAEFQQLELSALGQVSDVDVNEIFQN